LLDFDVLYVGALLLGFDLAQNCQPATRQKLLPIVAKFTVGNLVCPPFVRSYHQDEEQRHGQ
jgi:hypothetical protein